MSRQIKPWLECVVTAKYLPTLFRNSMLNAVVIQSADMSQKIGGWQYCCIF